jgi:hypothetical protein
VQPYVQIDQWVSSGTPNQEIDFVQASAIIASWKEFVIKKEVPAIFENTEVNKYPVGLRCAEQAIKKDTLMRAVRMARTDSNIRDILNYSVQYKSLAESNASSEATYTAFQNSLEKVIVNVKFITNPAQAIIELKPNGTPLGSTEFTKAFDAEQSYTFLIKKDGYRQLETTRYIPATPKDQTLEISLEKLQESSEGP